MLAVVSAAPAVRAQGTVAGQVTFAAGVAAVVAQPGQAGQPLHTGDSVRVGDLIETGQGGHVYLKLVDGAFLSVRPNSRLRVEAYDYDPAAPEASRVKYLLEDGVARSITGRAGQANKAGFRFNTPVAAIGIRGTDFVVQTTPTVTRAAVNSGRIVMSGFGGACDAAGLGPCGGTAAELGPQGAMRGNYYLEVRANQAIPVLVPAQGGNDVLSPKRDGTSSPEAPVTSPTATDNRASASTAEVVPQTVARDVSTSAVIKTLTPPTVFWGRWSVYQGGDADRQTAEALLARTDLTLNQANPGFGLFTSTAPLAMPASGRFSFTLADSEAYIQSGRMLEAAKVTRGSLDMNFSDRSFSTALGLTAASLPSELGLKAAGTVAPNGAFTSTSGNMDVRGALQGDATQAGYLFRSPLDASRFAIGAVRWVR